MSNIVNHSLTISIDPQRSEDMATLRAFVKDTIREGYAVLVPVPADLSDPRAIHDWIGENWGCANMYSDSIETVFSTEGVVWEFETGWSVPHHWLRAIAVKWPHWLVTLMSDSLESSFSSSMVWDGQEWKVSFQKWCAWCGGLESPHCCTKGKGAASA